VKELQDFIPFKPAFTTAVCGLGINAPFVHVCPQEWLIECG